MLSSSWLRNWKCSAPAARRRTQSSPRQRPGFRPRMEAIEDRCLLSGHQQTNLVGYQSSIATPNRAYRRRSILARMLPECCAGPLCRSGQP